jgi:DNA-binding NtrC family response regulator
MTQAMDIQEFPSTQRILVVDDDVGLSECVECLLSLQGYKTVMTKNADEGIRTALSDEFDLVITDLKLPDGSGLDIIRTIKEADPETPVILMTSYSSMETAIEALRLGATDYVMKPFNNTDFVHAVQRALKERWIRRENRILKRSLKKVYATREIAGNSPEMKQVLDLVSRVAPSDAPVLIEGESGTGKELVARAIHENSSRSNGPFVAINCGAIPADLVESELFGHAKGAYTGATSSSEGLVREANGGTLLLDEIGELPLPLQVKLLRVIQEREVRPVGGGRIHQIDVRFLASTNKSLRAEVDEGNFREDLFYRLNVINIAIPPLRERGDDVEMLAKRFIEHYSRKMGKNITTLGEDLRQFLRSYEWPGNVRELENLIERAIILSDSEVLTARHLMDTGNMGHQPAPSSEETVDESVVFPDEPLSVEDYIRECIVRYQDDHSETELARMLGVGRKALWVRRRKWGLFRNNKSQKRQAGSGVG